jgi:hypothetical protein
MSNSISLPKNGREFLILAASEGGTMRKSFCEAFGVVINEDQVLRLTELDGNTARVTLTACWLDPAPVLTTELVVPTITAKRFSWDQNIFGAKVQFTRAAARFCHPRLRSVVAEAIAVEPGYRDRWRMFNQTTDWQWEWQSYYDVLHELLVKAILELSQSRRRLTPAMARTFLQRAVQRSVNGIPGQKQTSLPLTDEMLTLRQQFEVRLMFPDIAADNRLWEMVKLKYLEFLDPRCDIIHTGKNKTGRDVIRFRPDAPKSHVTNHGVSDFALACNPLIVHALPTRVERENRSCQWLELVNPIAPPLKSTAVQTIPEAMQKRVTNLTVAFADVLDRNVFVSDETTHQEFGVEVGEVLALDGLLITPSGQEKLKAKRSVWSQPIDADDWEEQREELQELPGFEEEKLHELVEVLADGTPICTTQYRYRQERELPCRFDKVKLLVGGIKAVCRPIPQLWAQIGGKRVEVDLIVAAQSVISKGAADAILYALAANAGLTEIDPAWDLTELGEKIRKGLVKNGIDPEGVCPIFGEKQVPHSKRGKLNDEMAESLAALGYSARWEWEVQQIGSCIVGPCPAVRAEQTEYQQSSATRGMSCNVHLKLQAGIPFSRDDRTAEQLEALAGFFFEHSQVGGGRLPG